MHRLYYFRFFFSRTGVMKFENKPGQGPRAHRPAWRGQLFPSRLGVGWLDSARACKYNTPGPLCFDFNNYVIDSNISKNVKIRAGLRSWKLLPFWENQEYLIGDVLWRQKICRTLNVLKMSANQRFGNFFYWTKKKEKQNVFHALL